MKKIFTILLILLITNVSIEAQIFGRILDRAVDKLENKVENEIVERISEEIVRAAWKPVDKALDDMLRERYEQDSINGTTKKDYSGFLNEIMKPVDLPTEYNFDVILEAQTKNYNGDKNEMTLMFKKNEPIMAFVQKDKKKTTYMVMDMGKDITAIYSIEGDKKSVFAMSNVLSKHIAKNVINEDDPITMTKTGKTKKIAGYKTEEWLLDSKSVETKSYIAQDFPIEWSDSFGKLMKQMAP
ncbi:MAG: hypothetical protein V3V14_06020, partial [Saprospiraceae bacterium]